MLLSGSSLLKSKEFIGLLLEQNAPQIVNGVLYHKKYDKSINIQELWKKYEIDNIPVEFIEKLGKLINLDPLHCHDLFLAFLLYEFKGTPKSVQNLFTNEKNLQNLLLQLHEFYLSERLFSLFCLKQILANYHPNSTHPYQTLFNGFYYAVNQQNESILVKLIDQFDECINARIPNRNENGPYLNDNLINNWVKTNVMETLKILECILIYLKHSESNGKFTKQLITTFQKNTFFTRYQYFKQVATLSDSIKYENLVKLISFTQSLIIIESFKLNRFKEELVSGKRDHYLMTNTNLYNEINNIIQSKCNSLEVYSPVLLSWMLIKSLDQANASQEQIEYLGSTALNLNVFEYINNCLHSAEFENLSDSAFSTIAKNVVGTLLSNFFLQFDIDIIKPKLHLLFTICTRLFDDGDLVESMLKKQEDCGLYLIYLKSFSTFNLKNLIPFLQLTYSISKTNQNLTFLDVLTGLSSYSEYFNFNTPLISATEENGVYQLNADRRVFQENNPFTSNLIILKGSLGILREQNEERGNLIEWQNVQLDALKILIYLYKDRIDKVCYSGHYNDFIDEISLLNNIFANLIKSKPNHQLLQNIAESLYVLKMFRKYSNVPRTFIASAFNLFSTLVELDPKYETSIWEQISESGFFPYLTGLAKDQKLAGHEINASKIGELIVSEECMKGEFST